MHTPDDIVRALEDIRPYFHSNPDLVAPALAALIRGEGDAQRSTPVREMEDARRGLLNPYQTIASAFSFIGYASAGLSLAVIGQHASSGPPDPESLGASIPTIGLAFAAGAFTAKYLGDRFAQWGDPMAEFLSQGSVHQTIHHLNRSAGPEFARLVGDLSAEHRAEPIVALCRMPMNPDDKRQFLQERVWPMITQLPRNCQLEPLTALLESPELDPEFLWQHVLPEVIEQSPDRCGRLLGCLAQHLVRLNSPEARLDSMRRLIGHDGQGILMRLEAHQIAPALVPLWCVTATLPNGSQDEIETSLGELARGMPDRSAYGFSGILATPGSTAEQVFGQLLNQTVPGLAQQMYSTPLRGRAEFEELLHIGIAAGMARVEAEQARQSALPSFVAHMCSTRMGGLPPGDALPAARAALEAARQIESPWNGRVLIGLMPWFARGAMRQSQLPPAVRQDLDQVVPLERDRLRRVLLDMYNDLPMGHLRGTATPDADDLPPEEIDARLIEGLEALPFELLARVDAALRQAGGTGLLNASLPERHEELSEEQTQALFDLLDNELRAPALYNKGEIVNELQQALLRRYGVGEPPQLPADAAQRPEITAYADRLSQLVEAHPERWMPSTAGDVLTLGGDPQVRHSVKVQLHPQWQAVRHETLAHLQTDTEPTSASDEPRSGGLRRRVNRGPSLVGSATAALAASGFLPGAGGPRLFPPSLSTEMQPTPAQPPRPSTVRGDTQLEPPHFVDEGPATDA